MRKLGFAVVLVACLASGCTTKSKLAALDLAAPSPETTSSVVKPVGLTPPAAVGSVSALASVAEPPIDEAIAEAEAEAATPPAATVVALVAPAKPTARRSRFVAPKVYGHQFSDAKPINFGSASPRALPVHGVDVSRWQGEIDWVRLRSRGANFAYIKATDGGDHLDPMFRRNWRAAADAGMMRGAYHFFYWCRNAGEQADWFIRNVPKVEGALPPVLDVEWNGHSKNCRKQPSRERVLEKMRVFLDKVEKHYGQRPIIYTAPDFYRDNLRGEFKDYPFWLRSVAAHPSKVYPGRDWVFWQYSGSGLSHGLKGHIDLNVFNGNEQMWRLWLAKKIS